MLYALPEQGDGARFAFTGERGNQLNLTTNFYVMTVKIALPERG